MESDVDYITLFELERLVKVTEFQLPVVCRWDTIRIHWTEISPILIVECDGRNICQFSVDLSVGCLRCADDFECTELPLNHRDLFTVALGVLQTEYEVQMVVWLR